MINTTTPRCPNCDANLTYQDRNCPYCGADIIYDDLTGKFIKKEWEPVRTTYVRDIKTAPGIIEIDALEVGELGQMEEIQYIIIDTPPLPPREPPVLTTPSARNLLILTIVLSVVCMAILYIFATLG